MNWTAYRYCRAHLSLARFAITCASVRLAIGIPSHGLPQPRLAREHERERDRFEDEQKRACVGSGAIVWGYRGDDEAAKSAPRARRLGQCRRL